MSPCPVRNLVSLSKCADELGVAVRTVQRAIADGLPVVERGGLGKPFQIDIDAAREWWEANRPDPSVRDLPARRRREEYLAEREGIRLERDRARVLDRAQTARCIEIMISTLRETLTPLGRRIARHLNMNDEGQRILDDLITAELDRAAAGLSAISSTNGKKDR